MLLEQTVLKRHGGCIERSRIQSDEIFEESDVECSLFRAYSRSECDCRSKRERYDRAIATRGNDYLMVYNYTGRPMQIDLTKISGAKKNVWWYNTKNGKLTYIGEYDNKITTFNMMPAI